MSILITIFTLVAIGFVVAVPHICPRRQDVILLQMLAIEGALVTGLIAYTFAY